MNRLEGEWRDGRRQRSADSNESAWRIEKAVKVVDAPRLFHDPGFCDANVVANRLEKYSCHF
jgi:hypothetical protein